MLGTMKLLLKEGGVTGLWRGNGINVIKIAPESAIKFGAYDFLKKLVRGNADRELQLYERFLCGSLAGGISQTLIYPLEVAIVTLLRIKFILFGYVGLRYFDNLLRNVCLIPFSR